MMYLSLSNAYEEEIIIIIIYSVHIGQTENIFIDTETLNPNGDLEN